MELVYRPYYYSKVEKFLGTGVLLVLTGQRRVGKSYVMREVVQRKRQDSDSCVIYIDKEKTDFDFIQNYKDLVDNYLQINNWRVKENSTVTYSVGGLILSNSGRLGDTAFWQICGNLRAGPQL